MNLNFPYYSIKNRRPFISHLEKIYQCNCNGLNHAKKYNAAFLVSIVSSQFSISLISAISSPGFKEHLIISVCCFGIKILDKEDAFYDDPEYKLTDASGI